MPVPIGITSQLAKAVANDGPLNGPIKGKVMQPQFEERRQTKAAPHPARRIARWSNRRFHHFKRSEDGALYPFGLSLMMLMLMLGGLAVDLMRFEERRTVMQQTLDRSVLAAASMDQTLNPEAVVRDYFAKVDLTDSLKSVTVSEIAGNRSVSADVVSDTAPFFMHLLGINSLDVNAAATAAQTIANVEVSLVLDVSGSMAGERIDHLRPAAREFIDTVLASSAAGSATISIVPYNSQVNLGEPLFAQFNVAPLHSNSYCIELPDAEFNSISLSRTTPFVHNSHFDAARAGPAPSWFNCPPQPGNIVTPLSDDAAYLKGRIDALVAGGYTSIDVGMKWGALLLDPAAQPVVSGLIDRGVVKPGFSNRPQAAGSALKVLVLMSDGENTNEWKMNPPYRAGLSPIYRRNDNNSQFSVYRDVAGTNDYYWTSDRAWHIAPNGGTTGSTQLTWQQVWASLSVPYVAQNLYSPAMGGTTSTWQSAFLTTISAVKNSRLQKVCTAARDAGITVFTIGFEGSSDGRAQLRSCASNSANYFEAEGASISEAFRSISGQLSHLRLTQ